MMTGYPVHEDREDDIRGKTLQILRPTIMVAAAWRWQDRAAKPVEDSTMTMADTADNQTRHPTSRSQQSGLEFPDARVAALRCRVTPAPAPSWIPRSDRRQAAEQRPCVIPRDTVQHR